MAYTPDFALLLTEGTVVDSGRGPSGVILSALLGDVPVQTGHIVGCDPLTRPDAYPFTVTVPAGHYEMFAWIAVFPESGDEGDQRVAALELRLGDAPTTAWETALVDEASAVDDLGADECFGYRSESGRASLADWAAVIPLRGWDREEAEAAFNDEADRATPVPGFGEAITDRVIGGAVMAVEAGRGAGTYPTFIGRAADGTVTRFVTDFLMLPGLGGSRARPVEEPTRR